MKVLQLLYYHQYMIPCLNKSANAIIQICTEHKQNLTMNLPGAYLQHYQAYGHEILGQER
jgi:hypothetical protein